MTFSLMMVIIIAVVAIGIGYLISDYQSYSNINDILNSQNAILSGKAWGIFQTTAKAGTATANA